MAFYADAHRGSKPGAVRKALWARVKLAREIRDRLGDRRPTRYYALRGAFATLRRIWIGDYGATTPLMVACEERRNLWEATGAHMPPAMRQRALVRIDALNLIIAGLEREAAAARYAAEQADREEWLTDVKKHTVLTDERGGALIRAKGAMIDGCNVIEGELETSQGARVPLAHAVRAFRFVKRVKESGVAWEASGRSIRVGHFHIDRIDSTGDFVAGCHRINWGEIERLATLLGVFDCAPIDEESASDVE